LCNILEASATTFCAASSQLFGDSESISITFTIFGMSLISLPPSVSHHLGNMAASKVWLAGLQGACSRMAGKFVRRPAVAELWHGRRSGALQLLAEGTLSSCPNFRRLPSISSKSGLRCRGYLQNRFLQFLHINRFGEMSGKAGAAASLHVLLHPITADGDALGIADL
jgi:hypothetical protein